MYVFIFTLVGLTLYNGYPMASLSYLVKLTFRLVLPSPFHHLRLV